MLFTTFKPYIAQDMGIYSPSFFCSYIKIEQSGFTLESSLWDHHLQRMGQACSVAALLLGNSVLPEISVGSALLWFRKADKFGGQENLMEESNIY